MEPSSAWPPLPNDIQQHLNASLEARPVEILHAQQNREKHRITNRRDSVTIFNADQFTLYDCILFQILSQYSPSAGTENRFSD